MKVESNYIYPISEYIIKLDNYLAARIQIMIHIKMGDLDKIIPVSWMSEILRLVSENNNLIKAVKYFVNSNIKEIEGNYFEPRELIGFLDEVREAIIWANTTNNEETIEMKYLYCVHLGREKAAAVETAKEILDEYLGEDCDYESLITYIEGIGYDELLSKETLEFN